ncbi:MAG: patatin-like phospholipase family protein [Chloroflexota bacterium]|nr:patatin-like phospholipase family protein [Chloroflexota bacterium]
MPNGITLVLGGMGIKGAASIGVLQSMHDHDVKIKRIVATGISALVGAQFSLDRDLDALTDYFVRFFTENHRYLWGLERLSGSTRHRTRRIADSVSYFLRESLYCRANLNRISVLSWDIIERDLKAFFGEVEPSDLRVPVTVSAIDLAQGREVLLDEGNFADRLKAGIAFPGLFPPVNVAGREIIGSTLYCELPIDSLSEAERPIVAVDIPRSPSNQRPASALEVVAQMDELRGVAIKRKLLTKADRVFSLDELKGFQWGNYDQVPLMISRARQGMDRLLEG